MSPLYLLPLYWSLVHRTRSVTRAHHISVLWAKALYMKLNAALGRWTSSFPANRTMYFSDTDSRGSHQFWPWLKIFAWSARGAGEHMFILTCSYCTFAWYESGSSRMHWFGRNSYICCMVVSSPNYNLKCVEKRGLVFGKQFAVVLAAQWKLAWKCSWLCFAKDTWWIPRSFRMIALCWVLPVWLSLICNPNRICERCGLAIAKVNSILTAALAPLQTCFEFLQSLQWQWTSPWSMTASSNKTCFLPLSPPDKPGFAHAIREALRQSEVARASGQQRLKVRLQPSADMLGVEKWIAICNNTEVE